MKYMLMSYVNEAGWPKLSKAEQEQGMAAYVAYTEALAKSGVLKDSGRLQPSSTATTVRIADGKSQVLDGPFVDSKEQLGGFFIIDVPDPDALAAEFLSREVEFSEPLKDTSDGLRGFELKDTDGYVLFFGRPNRQT